MFIRCKRTNDFTIEFEYARSDNGTSTKNHSWSCVNRVKMKWINALTLEMLFENLQSSCATNRKVLACQAKLNESFLYNHHCRWIRLALCPLVVVSRKHNLVPWETALEGSSVLSREKGKIHKREEDDTQLVFLFWWCECETTKILWSTM